MANEPAKEDVYVDKEGNRVSGDDPASAFQVAFKGVPLDAKTAERYKKALGADAPKHVAKAATSKGKAAEK